MDNRKITLIDKEQLGYDKIDDLDQVSLETLRALATWHGVLGKTPNEFDPRFEDNRQASKTFAIK